jgi:hypothetical protein
MGPIISTLQVIVWVAVAPIQCIAAAHALVPAAMTAALSAALHVWAVPSVGLVFVQLVINNTGLLMYVYHFLILSNIVFHDFYLLFFMKVSISILVFDFN